ncbi:hypothetical protein [Ruegeria arenilitoris]|uniref:hypothetical protein n=1 Tax=Ruegeria arenilitoris TaxID=1173585 RepID=UPI00147FA8DE|nr:hypothetical protein [Ruegeria arenilitoris]
MYLFRKPEDVLKLVDRNFATMVLGSKESDPTVYRAWQRADANNTPISQMKKSAGGRAAIKAADEFLRGLDLKEEDFEYYRSATYEDVATFWAQQLFTWKLKKTLPDTVAFVNALAKGSVACRHLWESGERAAAIQMVSDLPWANTDTMQWYLSVLRTNRDEITDEWHLPAQAMTMSAIARMVMLEGSRLGSPSDRAWNIHDLMGARHPDTGDLVAIRYFMDQTLAAAEGVETHSEFADLALKHVEDDDTRQREAKKYRAGKVVPPYKQCLQINENMKSFMSERSAEELFYLANIACFCQKLYRRLQKTQDLGLDPITPFDDFKAFRDMPENHLKEAMKHAASHEFSMGF